MAPPGWPHTLAKTKTGDILRAAFAGRGWVNEQSPLPAEDSVPLPDVAVYPGRVQDYTDHPTAALLVVEVSHTSLDRDLTVKAELYAEAGVPEYWVVDVDARQLRVFRDPQTLPGALGVTAYRSVAVFGEGDAVSPVGAAGAVVRVVELL